MKKLFIILLFVVFVAGCSTPDVLTYGNKMKFVETRWGKPDDTLAYKDYRDARNYSVAGAGGSWSSQGGSASGFGYAETYAPTAIVWIYKDRGKALFFEKRGLLFDERQTLIMKWKLVGWQNLTHEDQGLKRESNP